MNVDIEIYFTDAALLGAMRTTLVPTASAGPRLPDICKPQAAPLWQLAAALASASLRSQ
jgi:hypothetical protein